MIPEYGVGLRNYLFLQNCLKILLRSEKSQVQINFLLEMFQKVFVD